MKSNGPANNELSLLTFRTSIRITGISILDCQVFKVFLEFLCTLKNFTHTDDVGDVTMDPKGYEEKGKTSLMQKQETADSQHFLVTFGSLEMAILTTSFKFQDFPSFSRSLLSSFIDRRSSYYFLELNMWEVFKPLLPKKDYKYITLN